jgi:hypothetical protein
MASLPQKPAAPAFTSYRPLTGFLNQFREDGHIPLRVDKSHLPKASGSVILGHLHALKYLKLIDDAGKPLPLFERFVMASDAERGPILSEVLRNAYPWLFNDPEFDLARASSKQVEEKFRAQEITGSTVIRAISFFLSAAKDAGIKTSPGLKAPPQPQRNGAAKKAAPASAKKAPKADGDDEDDEEEDEGHTERDAVMKFEIPIPINRKVRISIPADFDEADWTLLQTMFNAYVTRWKGIKPPAVPSAPPTAKKEGG